jgi:TonB-dependent starch-binding outer membrane protein SusC
MLVMKCNYLPRRLHAACMNSSPSSTKKIYFLLGLFTLFFTFTTFAQQKITGKVTSGDKPLANATVKQKGASASVITTEAGDFSITVTGANPVLIFSYVGMETLELSAENKTTITVVMTPVGGTLGDVVVVGYGTQKKTNLTGAVGTIKSDYIKDRPITNASQALSGGVAGVFVNQNSGVPGSDGAVIRIRGIGTLNNTSPLVLVDGIESTLDNLDPNDIASISVLKDAASASIYGSRASNGVVLVTTKRGGLNRKPTISYSGYYGTSQASNVPSVITNSAQFMELANEASVNSGSAERYTPAQIAKYRQSGPNTDWVKEIFSKGAIQQHNVSVSGGSTNTGYLLSFGTLNQDAITPNSGFKRYNLRLNLDTKIGEKFSVGTNLFLSRGNYTGPQNDIVGTGGDGGIAALALKASPLTPKFDSQGRLAAQDQSLINNTWGNPFANILYQSFNRLSHQFLGSAFAEYEIIKGLKVKGTLALNYQNSDGNIFYNRADQFDWVSGNVIVPSINNLRGRYRSNNFSNDVTTWVQATYTKTINKHKFDLLAGANQESYRFSYFDASRNNFPTNSVQILNAGNAATSTNSEFATEWALRSYFGRLNYNYDNRYLIEVNVRRDGSSRFGTDNRYGTFPSVSAGWNVAKEAFFKSKIINALKIRGSYGQLGNQYAQGTDYPYAAQVSVNTNYVLNGTVVPGAAQTTFNNPNIKWETTTSSDIGVDIELIKKITVQADYFVRTTQDILYALPLPATAGGLANPVVNTAKVQNKGWEFSADYKDKFGAFSFNVGFNVTHVKSKLLYIDSKRDADQDKVINGNFILERGASLNSIYGLKAIGIFQSAAEVTASPTQLGTYGPGDLKYADLNGDNKIDDKDRTIIGQENPEWLYGATVSLGFKGFDLSAIIQGVGNFQSYSGSEFYAPFFNNANVGTQWLDRWTPTNTGASYPRLYYSTGSSSAVSSFWIQNRSFLRLKNVQLGYNIPAAVLSKIKIQNIRLYINGQNLLTKTKFNGFDPERPDGATRGGDGYPVLKIYTVGLNVTF